MQAAIGKALVIIASLAFLAIYHSEAKAEARQYCVVCEDPDQSYVCRVETPYENPSDKGMRLYCIIRTSKDGGHKSCKVDINRAVDACTGPVKTYTFKAPAASPELRSAIDRLRKSREKNETDQNLPQQKGGEPETLIDMTGRAVKASREGLSNTGQAVSGAASTTTGTVGKAARGVGKGVTKAAGKVGSATKKTGGAVSNAAKTAFDCLKSFFKECGSGKTDTPPPSQ